MMQPSGGFARHPDSASTKLVYSPVAVSPLSSSEDMDVLNVPETGPSLSPIRPVLPQLPLGPASLRISERARSLSMGVPSPMSAGPHQQLPLSSLLPIQRSKSTPPCNFASKPQEEYQAGPTDTPDAFSWLVQKLRKPSSKPPKLLAAATVLDSVAIMNLKQLQEERSKVRSALHKLKEKKGADTAGTVRLLREKMHAIETRLRELQSPSPLLSTPPAVNSAPYSSHFGGAGAGSGGSGGLLTVSSDTNTSGSHSPGTQRSVSTSASTTSSSGGHYSSRSQELLSSSIVTVVHPSGIPVAPRPASRSFISYPL